MITSRVAAAKAMTKNYNILDFLFLAMGASVSALHWVCAQDLLQVTPFFHHNT
jgi:hypothetical protein